MDLRLPTYLGKGYKSGSQLARRITEPCGAENLYCCSCNSDHLDPEKTNAQVSDFLCSECAGRYQLKSQSRKLGSRILGSNYERMLDAVLRNKTPHFFLLHYQLPEWIVRNLLLIPRFAISPSVLIKRQPLSAEARRSEWIGYVLDIRLIPESAKIPLIRDGTEVNRDDVRERYARIARLQALKPEQRGWTLDVLRCVESLSDPVFTNDQIYSFEANFAELYPANHNIRPKIRQQLQVLRDRGLLRSPRRGVWQRN
ncbi:MAG TPA: DpnI domain-containing protein [Opitutus sp.]|nr:DpnI domain-containing protein [Opitutus sp.]